MNNNFIKKMLGKHEFDDSTNMVDLLKDQLEHDGFKCTVLEGHLFFETQDKMFGVPLEESALGNYARNVGFIFYRGAEGSGEVPDEHLSRLGVLTMLKSESDASVIWNGESFVIYYRSDIRTLNEFRKLRDYAIKQIAIASDFLAKVYPSLYESCRQPHPHKVGFQMHKEEGQTMFPAAENSVNNPQ